ncbi:MAG TPA: hypothetical protein VFQ43_01350 [Nitrososphaera sp.]|nr:hypothetical protein [Nitrososphaera sp.]
MSTFDCGGYLYEIVLRLDGSWVATGSISKKKDGIVSTYAACGFRSMEEAEKTAQDSLKAWIDRIVDKQTSD